MEVGLHNRSPGAYLVYLPHNVLAAITIREATDVALRVRTRGNNIIRLSKFVVTFRGVLAANPAEVSDCHSRAVAKSDVHQRKGTSLGPFLAVMNEATAKDTPDKLASKVCQLVSLI
jgi:hypothetical protein